MNGGPQDHLQNHRSPFVCIKMSSNCSAAHRAHSEGTLDDRKVIIELFAGSTALGTVARQAGFDYVAYDFSKSSEKSFRRLHDEADIMEDYFDIGVAAAC